MEADRLNSPSTSAITLEVLGHQLQFSQDPNSKHLGTTVWDASMVFVKFLERNCRKGRFSPSKLKGKRVVELGAGCGVAGFGMALLGCDVVATDQIEVLPLLMRNVERNISRIMQTDSSSDSYGSIKVEELDWGNEGHMRAVDPPFDYIIGTDVVLTVFSNFCFEDSVVASVLKTANGEPSLLLCGVPKVYAEHLLEPLLKTIFALSGPKTTILLGYEIRSTNVHEQMLDMWKRNFEVKTVPKAKMDSKYQHPSIQLYIMGLKPPAGSLGNLSSVIDHQKVEDEMVDKIPKEDEDSGCSSSADKMDGQCHKKLGEDYGPEMKLPNGELTDWEARRFGSMAARLLRDVKIT